MPRLIFSKKGNAVWISHLDLMRLFQRAFKRANLNLKHTQGYNPRPSVSIALPLSVGIASNCELLDFEIENDGVTCAEIKERINAVLVNGITVREVYAAGAKVRDISLLSCALQIKFCAAISDDDTARIAALFDRDTVVVPKKTKNGVQDQNIIPMIRRIAFRKTGENTVEADCLICCQNPTLNPMQIAAAIQQELPELKQELCLCTRIEVFKSNEEVFR